MNIRGITFKLVQYLKTECLCISVMIEKGDKESGEPKPLKPSRKRARRKMKGAHRRPRLTARPRKLKEKGEARAAKNAGSTSEAKEMIRRIEEMYADLEDKLQYIYEHMHLLPAELQMIVHQPEAFMKEHEKILDVFEEDLEAKVVNILGKKTFEAQKKKQKKKQAKKGRRAQKLRGKKRWIPLQ